MSGDQGKTGGAAASALAPPGQRTGALAWLVVGAAALYAGTFPLFGGHRAGFYFVQVVTVKLLALVGCLAAALRYRSGDRMRLIWLLFLSNFGLLLCKDLLFGIDVALPWPAFIASKVVYIGGALTLVGNVLATLALVLLARTWRVAGLTPSGSPRAQRLILLGAIALALVLVGWGTKHDVAALRSGQPVALMWVTSDLADVVQFSLIAPLLLTAISLRGGTLFWPYLFLSASVASWLLYDMTSAYGGALGMSGDHIRALCELWRVIACALGFCAGMAQRWAVRPSGWRKRAAAAPARPGA